MAGLFNFSTEQLLSALVLMTGTLNILVKKSNAIYTKLLKAYNKTNRFLRKNLKLEKRNEMKLDYLLTQHGANIDKFNIDADRIIDKELGTYDILDEDD